MQLFGFWDKILTNDEINYWNEALSYIIISYTDKELKRAQSYIKKRWAPDNTINMAAWNHAKQIKVVNTDIKLATKKLEKDTKVQMVSSSN